MNVIDVMTAHPITIRSEQPLGDALELMERHHIKHLPVVNGRQHMLGIVTDMDCRHALNSPFIRRERWQNEALIKYVLMRSIMSPAPIVIEPDAPAVEAVRLMLSHNIGCLPVMRGETLIGILTRSDILIAFMTLQRRFEQLPVESHNDASLSLSPSPSLKRHRRRS
jgi:acetoin utilization protein AcuB